MRQHQGGPTYPWQVVVPPDTNAGIPYNFQWEPPYFPQKVPVHLMPTEFVSLTPETLPPHVEGIAWMKGWEPPFFHRPYQTKVELQQTSMWSASPEFNPVPISGAAWYTPWEPAYRQWTNISVMQQTTLQTFRFFRVGRMRFYIMGGGR